VTVGAVEKRVLKRFCATVLIMEAVVIGLSIPVAIQIDHLASGSAGTAGGIAAVAAIAVVGLLRRALPAALVGGTLLQILVISSGVIVPVMYVLGAIFAGLWVIGIWLGYRLEPPAPT
jgi:Protein of unknown function (DUF4233)